VRLVNIVLLDSLVLDEFDELLLVSLLRIFNTVAMKIRQIKEALLKSVRLIENEKLTSVQ
jgi:hypothetical protein